MATPCMVAPTTSKIRNLTRLIGNTPLLGIEFTYRGQPRVIYAKFEQFNLTGSIKDRMALHILERAYAEGKIAPGDKIVEATSGNSGISFAALGRALGHPVTIFVPGLVSRERVDLIHSLGARIVLVGRDQGGLLASIRLAEELAAEEEHIFLPHRFSNEAGVEAHERTTGPEIWWQLQSNGLTPHAFVAGVGTGGTIMGVGRALRRQIPSIQLHALEAAESPTLSSGQKLGRHRIQGIAAEFAPPIVELDYLDAIVSVHDGDAILMAQKLAAQLGLGVGISSGANFLGALKIQSQMGSDAVVATVLPDSNKKYLGTELLHDEPVRDDYLTPDVELTGFHTYKRVCHTCNEIFDPAD